MKTIPFDAESRKDQDGSKQKAVQELMAELRAIFCLPCSPINAPQDINRATYMIHLAHFNQSSICSS